MRNLRKRLTELLQLRVVQKCANREDLKNARNEYFVSKMVSIEPRTNLSDALSWACDSFLDFAGARAAGAAPTQGSCSLMSGSSWVVVAISLVMQRTLSASLSALEETLALAQAQATTIPEPAVWLVTVGSPKLADANPKTLQQQRELNVLCRIIEE